MPVTSIIGPPDPRYALYFAPADTSRLWQFGCSVLGFDAAEVAPVAHPGDPVFQDPAIATALAGPRRYGFHATLKAPFRLRSGRTEAELETQLQGFSAARTPVPIRLRLASIHDFVALVLDRPSPDLDRLAADCVRQFDEFRAPLSEGEIARRRPERLSPRERETLDTWGYPFCFKDFRFHMTLSGPLDPRRRATFEAALARLFEAVEPDVVVDAVTLFRQDAPDARFRILRRFPFGD